MCYTARMAKKALLLLSILILLFIVFVEAMIIIDQYPCFVGVPNCD
jgi:hypothetical protein